MHFLLPYARIELLIRTMLTRTWAPKAKLRKELTATRIAVYGLLLVIVLSHYGASRAVVHGTFVAIMLVVVFLGCRWGVGDTELSLGQSIGVTLTMAVLVLLLMLWKGI